MGIRGWAPASRDTVWEQGAERAEKVGRRERVAIKPNVFHPLETKRCLLLTTAASATHTIRRAGGGGEPRRRVSEAGPALTFNNGVVVMVMSHTSKRGG